MYSGTEAVDRGRKMVDLVNIATTYLQQIQLWSGEDTLKYSLPVVIGWC